MKPLSEADYAAAMAESMRQLGYNKKYAVYSTDLSFVAALSSF